VNLNLEFHRRTNIKSTSPRSERQNYRTARGSERVMHPLHLPACYRKRFRILSCVTLFVFLISLSGCSRRSGGGINAGTGGWPPSSSSTPAEVSSSAQVVKVIVPSAIEIARGNSAEAIVRLSISTGYHINANPATFPYLIATAITPGKAEGIIVGKPAYPIAEKRKFQFEEQPLAVYEDEVQIRLSLHADPKASPDSRSLPISVRVQACDNEKCYPPANLETTIPIEVK